MRELTEAEKGLLREVRVGKLERRSDEAKQESYPARVGGDRLTYEEDKLLTNLQGEGLVGWAPMGDIRPMESVRQPVAVFLEPAGEEWFAVHGGA
jgi:hypothetical protein